MRKKKAEKKSHSLRTLVIYGAFVIALVLISFTIRLFYLIEQSKFDGKHRFTLVIGEEKSTLPKGSSTRQDFEKQGGEGEVLGIISFEPMTSSLSLLTFPKGSNLSFSTFSKKSGVITDGFIRTRYNMNLEETIPSLLQSFLIRPNAISTNVNFYDLLRLYWHANKVPVSSIVVDEISDKSFLLIDNAISAENVSVQIVNAAGQSGLGSRLERVISNLGGNVVSVKTAMVTQPVSKIMYYGEKTYTLGKLEKLLPIKTEVLDKEDIARIVIIIGEDNKDTLLF